MNIESKPRLTDTAHFIGELNGGVVEQQLGHLLSDVALGVVTNGKKGRVVLTLDMEQISGAAMVKITSTVSHVTPTLRGKKSEEISAETPMHVNSGGKLTVMPENQTDMFRETGHAGR